MTECWLSCFGLPGYEVSNLGRVRSIDRTVQRSDTGTKVKFKGIIQKCQVDKYGYVRVRLSVNNVKSSHRVHRLVAKAFIPNPDNLPQVNHIDGNKQNNATSNLEWINNSDNQIHALSTGLKVPKKGSEHSNFTGTVLAINTEGKIVATMNGNKEMEANGFDYRLVSACLKGKRKTHKGCSFRKETYVYQSDSCL